MGNRDDRDPFDDIFRELNRLMNDMMGEDFEMHVERDGGFGSEVHISTQETDEEIYVIADLPGVRKDDIDIKCDGTAVTIAAATHDHEYEERLRLPATVDEHSARATFNNGILEIVFDRADSSADIDLR